MTEKTEIEKDFNAGRTPILPSGLYDFAKDATTLYIPALAVAYSGLATIWDWGFSAEVVGTAAVLVTLLGVLLKISSNQYQKLPPKYDGEVIVNHHDPMVDNYRLVVDVPWDELEKKDQIVLKVDEQVAPSQ